MPTGAAKATSASTRGSLAPHTPQGKAKPLPHYAVDNRSGRPRKLSLCWTLALSLS